MADNPAGTTLLWGFLRRLWAHLRDDRGGEVYLLAQPERVIYMDNDLSQFVEMLTTIGSPWPVEDDEWNFPLAPRCSRG